MTFPEPRRIPSWLVRIASRSLPAAHRARYREELLAELCQLPRKEQLGFAVRVLVRSLNLRVALNAPTSVAVRDVVVAAPVQPFTCRMHLHHRWKHFSTDDGHRYLACSRCGKDKEGNGDTIGYIAPSGF